jgi:hypothetical protein
LRRRLQRSYIEPGREIAVNIEHGLYNWRILKPEKCICHACENSGLLRLEHLDHRLIQSASVKAGLIREMQAHWRALARELDIQPQ